MAVLSSAQLHVPRLEDLPCFCGGVDQWADEHYHLPALYPPILASFTIFD